MSDELREAAERKAEEIKEDFENPMISYRKFFRLHMIVDEGESIESVQEDCEKFQTACADFCRGLKNESIFFYVLESRFRKWGMRQTDNPKLISMINMANGKRHLVKSGKAFARALDNKVSEKDVDEFTRWYRERVLGTGKPVIHVGETRFDFKHAYSHDRSTNYDPHTTSDRKSLKYSCMHYDVDEFPTDGIHPCEVYASGDFYIIWAEDETGKIAGRTVVYKNEGGVPKRGPVYGMSEVAIDAILEKFRELGGEDKPNDWDGWYGAKLLRLTNDSGDVIAPYLDISNCASDEGDHLLLNSNGLICLEFTNGLAGAESITCVSCSNHIYQVGDEYHTNEGNIYCESCFDEHFVYSEVHYEYIDIDSSICVRVNMRWCDETYVYESEAICCELTGTWYYEGHAEVFQYYKLNGEGELILEGDFCFAEWNGYEDYVFWSDHFEEYILNECREKHDALVEQQEEKEQANG